MNVTSKTSILADKKRPCVFPIPLNRKRIWAWYKQMRALDWDTSEVRLTVQDKNDWAKLTADERKFLEPILAFFAVSDTLVEDNLMESFMATVDSLEVQFAWTQQATNEQVHAETYSRLVDFFIEDPTRRDELLARSRVLPSVQLKTDWIQKWMSADSGTFGERLFAFAVVEGVLFSGSFCAIDWVRERGLLPGLTAANDFIARDEGTHTDFAVLLNEHLAPGERVSREKACAIIRGAVETEQHFICKAIPCRLIGMNAPLMCRYIEYVADRLLLQFGHPAIYNSANPFDFMEVKSVRSKENFFEKSTLTNYSKAFVKTENPDKDMEFDFNAEF